MSKSSGKSRYASTLCVGNSGVLKRLLVEARAVLEQTDPDFAAELLPREWPSAVARRAVRELEREMESAIHDLPMWRAAAEAYAQHRYDPEASNLILTLHDDVNEALKSIRDQIIRNDAVNDIIDRQHPGRKLPKVTLVISALVFVASLAPES